MGLPEFFGLLHPQFFCPLVASELVTLKGPLFKCCVSGIFRKTWLLLAQDLQKIEISFIIVGKLYRFQQVNTAIILCIVTNLSIFKSSEKLVYGHHILFLMLFRGLTFVSLVIVVGMFV